MPTLEGIVFIPLALYFFFESPGLLFPLLVFSAVFQASSIISSGPVGLQPYYCVAILFIFRHLVMGKKMNSGIPKKPYVRLWVAFLCISVLSAMVLPIAFSGILVFDPRYSTYENIIGPSPLQFRLGNAIQAVFLLINVLVLITASRTPVSIPRAHKMFRIAAYTLVGCVVLQELTFRLGLAFPYWLVNNNPGYEVVGMSAINLRPPGTFTEPSMAGAVLAAFVAAFLWQYFAGRSGIARAGIAAAACLLVASSSSLFAVLVMFGWLALTNSPFRFPWFIRLKKLKRMAIFLVSGFVLLILMALPAIRNVVLSQTLEKSGSDSAVVRVAADVFALSLVSQTHGLGVGLGSNRPSSLAPALLSQVGIPGLALFLCAAANTLWNLPLEHRWISLAAAALLISMAIGLPDISFPFLWILFALAAQSKAALAVEVIRKPVLGNKVPSPG